MCQTPLRGLPTQSLDIPLPTPALQRREPRLKEFKQLPQSHPAGKWQSWDCGPGRFDSYNHLSTRSLMLVTAPGSCGSPDRLPRVAEQGERELYLFRLPDLEQAPSHLSSSLARGEEHPGMAQGTPVSQELGEP